MLTMWQSESLANTGLQGLAPHDVPHYYYCILSDTISRCVLYCISLCTVIAKSLAIIALQRFVFVFNPWAVCAFYVYHVFSYNVWICKRVHENANFCSGNRYILSIFTTNWIFGFWVLALGSGEIVREGVQRNENVITTQTLIHPYRRGVCR